MGLYNSKLNNFSKYVDTIFVDEDDLCGMIEKMCGENIPANIVRRWLKMSPMQFIDFMNDGRGPVCSLEEEYREHDRFYGPYFKTGYLKYESFTIHVYDWLDWQKARAGVGVTSSPDAELDQARAELAALREENAVLKAELEEVRQEKGQAASKWYGLIAVVEKCRSEGKTPQETAVELKARGASYAIIGGLLHPEGDISDWTQYGSNIVEGNTKKLAW